MLQVLRWSALGLGLFYGITHQASISARDRTTAAQRDWKHKEDTIAKAKAEYARKNAPYDVKTGAGMSSRYRVAWLL